MRSSRIDRAWIIGALGVGGAIVFARLLGGHQPLRSWLFFQLAAIWAWQLYLAAACASVGYRLADRILPAGEWTAFEKLAVGYPVGVVVFVLGLTLAGFLHLFGPALAVVLPGVLLAAGAPVAVRSLRSWHATGGTIRVNLSGVPLAAAAVGLLLLGVLYLGALSPDAINYDASWNHLVIAQDYAREGRIVGFPGDWIKNLPHLGSVLNTWAFLVPGLERPALRWMMALHTEFCAFLWTLAGIAAAARWLLDRRQAATWTAFALFPGIFVYDGNIGGSADHFLALFAAPLLLVTCKALPRLERGACLFAGALAGGALLTKAQGVYLVAPLAILLDVRAVQLTAGRTQAPASVWKTAGLTAGVGAAVLLPHLAANFVFFRNPLYPLLQDVFTASTPTVPDAAMHVTYMLADWRYRAPEPLLAKITDGAKLAFTFSFVPHYSWVNNLPAFGSMFTLSLPLLAFLRGARRIVLGALIAVAAVLAWAVTYRVDRNLQGVTPVLIAVTAAILVRAWEVGRYARIGVGALVLVQISWASHLYFQGADRVSGAAHLLRSTMTGRANEALDRYRKEYVALGQFLPESALLMLHDFHSMLGIDRRVVLDWVGFQGLFDYRLYKTPRDLHDRLRALGVTHVAWLADGPAARSKQEELIFDAFADACGKNARHFGPMTVIAVPTEPPPPTAPYRVLVVGLRGYADGIYPVDALSTCDELPPQLQRHAAPAETQAPPDTAWALLDKANALFVGGSAPVDGAIAARLSREFRQLRSTPDFRLLVRP